jgi:hypothetical protein
MVKAKSFEVHTQQGILSTIRLIWKRFQNE